MGTLAYYLYFMGCICAVIALTIKIETLLLIAKPVSIPSICFYLTKAKSTDAGDDAGARYITPMTIYGIVLSIMVSLSVCNYLITKSIGSFYLMLFCLCSLVSDVFYAIYNFHFHIRVLSYINSGMQPLSYFFIVKYVICRKSAVHIKSAINA